MNDELNILLNKKKKFNLKTSAQKEQFVEEKRRIHEKERELKRKEDRQFRENLIEEIVKEYYFNRAIAKACVDKGWENGHAYGYSEVRIQSQIAADFAEQIITINKE